MYVTKCPVIVTLVYKLIERTGGIVGVPFHTTQCCMEYANVELTHNWLGIISHQVDCYVALPVALTVESNIIFCKMEGFGSLSGKRLHVIWEHEPAGNLALGIVVSIEQEDRSTGCCEPGCLLDEVKPRLIITPVPVIEITSDDDKGDFFPQSLVNKICKRLASRCSDTFSSIVLLPGKSLQGTVEMNICRVDKPERSQGIPQRSGIQSEY